MKKILGTLAALAIAAGITLTATVPASADVGTTGVLVAQTPQANNPGYWEDYGPHEGAECYSHNGNSDHGSITNDGLTVTLNAFNPSWPGDHWELLVVKGGNLWNNVIVHPTAGVAYASPQNAGGQQSAVSHWIVCKGTTPDEPDPDDAAAAITTTPGTCSTTGTATVTTLNHAVYDGILDLTVGTHTETFQATQGHTFPGGGTTLDVEYTIAGKDLSQCPQITECPAYGAPVHITSLGALELGETSGDGTGHVLLGTDNLHVYTDAAGHRKAAFYIDVNFPLASLGEFGLTQAGTGSQVGGQVRVDITGDGVWDFTLVDEALYGGIVWASIPGGQTWVSQSWAPHTAGGGGYPNQGTYDEWLTALSSAGYTPVVDKIGGSLGSGVTGDQRVTSLKAGCVEYTFGAPAAPADEYRESDERTVDCEAIEATITTTYERRDYGAWDEATQSYPLGDWYVYDTDEATDELTEDEILECAGDQPDPLTGTDRTLECDESTLVVTNTSWSQAYVLEGTTWVLGDKVYDEPRVTRQANDAACVFPPVLALTGVSAATAPIALTAVAALFVLGIALLTVVAVQRRRTDSTSPKAE